MNYLFNKNKQDKKEGGFIQLIIIIVIALLLMRHFNLKISGVLAYFNLTPADVGSFIKGFFVWLKDLFNSVK
jgi:uncharacterized membrane-anchored protein